MKELTEKNKQSSMVVSLAIKIIGILIMAFGIGLFFSENSWFYAKGLAFGGIFSILRLKLMEISLYKATSLPPDKAQAYGSFQYFIRFILAGVVLVVAALEPSIDIIGTIIGLLASGGAAVLQGLLTKPTPKDGSVEFVEWEEDEDDETSDF